MRDGLGNWFQDPGPQIIDHKVSDFLFAHFAQNASLMTGGFYTCEVEFPYLCMFWISPISDHGWDQP